MSPVSTSNSLSAICHSGIRRTAKGKALMYASASLNRPARTSESTFESMMLVHPILREIATMWQTTFCDLQQCFKGVTILWRYCDGGGHTDLKPSLASQSANYLNETTRKRATCRLGCVQEYSDKVLFLVPKQHVGGPQNSPRRIDDMIQRRISYVAPESDVDLLKVVNIDQQNRRGRCCHAGGFLRCFRKLKKLLDVW